MSGTSEELALKIYGIIENDPSDMLMDDVIEGIDRHTSSIRAERDEEQLAHQKIGTLCAEVGATDTEGTSVSAVKDLVRMFRSANAERDKWKERAERAETQLAGCGTAAMGWNQNPAKQGDWGWSASYQDVLDLRRKWEALNAERDHALAGVAEMKKLAADAVKKLRFTEGSSGLGADINAFLDSIADDILAIPTELADAQVAVMKLEAKLEASNFLVTHAPGRLPHAVQQYLDNLESELATARHAADELRGGKSNGE